MGRGSRAPTSSRGGSGTGMSGDSAGQLWRCLRRVLVCGAEEPGGEEYCRKRCSCDADTEVEEGVARCGGAGGWTANSREATTSIPAQPTRTPRAQCGPLPYLPTGPLRLLLVFSREDAVGEALRSAASRLGWDCRVERKTAPALQAYKELQPHLVIIDRRHTKGLDGDELCRSIRKCKGGQFAVIFAVVRRSYVDKGDDLSMLQIINVGYDRWLVETTSVGACMAEITQAEHCDVSLKQQLATANTLLVALNKCREIIHVTDASHQIQYVNRASERLIGYRLEEARGKCLLQRGSEDEVMTQQLLKGHSWEGSVACSRQTGDSVTLNCRIVPVAVSSRSPTHLVWVHDPPLLLAEKTLSDTTPDGMYPLPRGSLRSIRKASYDIKSLNSDGSQFIRRQSLAKLHALTMEAPITRVMSLIYAAQENCPPGLAPMLDKVMDILRSSELYSPRLTEESVRPDDPVTSDLIGALLSQGPKPLSTRRSSSESTVKSHRGSVLPRGSLPAIAVVPANLQELLESDVMWEFDIFKLERLSQYKPLVWLGLKIFCRFEVPQVLNIDETTLQNWLNLVEANYHGSNSYHNSTHAADVLQATAVFLEQECLKEMLEPLDEAACLIAATVHDIDHPGKSSAFLINSSNELAILYNDLCVLESHHSALTFKLTLSDDRVNIFKGLESDKYKILRQSVIDMVLATEMTKHFEHMTKFVNAFTKPASREEDGFSMEVSCDASECGYLNSPENVALVKRMLIKCADVSNPTRPLKLCVEWTKRIADEYFNQTDEEKKNNLPVVMPMFDRATCSIPKSQIGFVEYIINDMFEAWSAFIDMPELIQYLKANYQYWKEKEQLGITNIEELNEIEKE
ncbi:high affinity cAMP-specific and IBMX-insensitive 3',5'-cyclic phosphodiesterase 8-like [Ischnura elegans]|uniref:high affinity cAMP-specific and IBMX-insensitive 3',5'-cyclic phosphodiesterase 8-like n=1 Tax=Ischnura elegans TaxID=197161 RepID=UPI001ED869E8|nr:high affinity cAMP-specific and IBMX-insensitive 3',5'-cyclic phosphodiesterase 8-like [Ischnura elegans]